MRNDKLEKELELLLLLTENRSLTLKQLCEKVGVSRRTLYYYLEFFRDTGFKLEKYGNCYSINRESKFFGRLTERISFTEEEAIVIRRLLGKVDKRNALVETLKRKIDKFYDFGILADYNTDEHAAQNINKLHEAIKYELKVVLRNYSSPHSSTTRDRLVEPFMLMDGNCEARCFEPASGMNKTFKVARMGEVEILDDPWQFKDQHRQMFTDAFMFSGDKTMTVEMVLGQLSHNILTEEYPKTISHITKIDNSHWLLQLKVCSYIGIGRFVLGLLNDIEIKGDEGFREYINGKLQTFNTLYNTAAQVSAGKDSKQS